MDGLDREKLKHELRAMAAGRGDGINLDSPDCWIINGLTDSVAFFRHLDRLIPMDSVLYFEGCETVPEVAQFYESNRAANPVAVKRDTIYPVPDTFHVSMSPAAIDGIIDLLSRHTLPECFYHVKSYREGKLLFTYHDAFDGYQFVVSDCVSEDCVRAFCSAIGVTWRRDRIVTKRDPEELRKFNEALDRYRDLHFGRPWWKKILFFWKK